MEPPTILPQAMEGSTILTKNMEPPQVMEGSTIISKTMEPPSFLLHDVECTGCIKLKKLLSCSREWNRFFQQKLHNHDKLLHMAVDYEKEKQHSVELQLAYDQRTRDASYLREQMTTLLLEMDPLKEKLSKAEADLKESTSRAEQAEDLVKALQFAQEQLLHEVRSLRVKVEANKVEVLERKLTRANGKVRRLNVSLEDKNNEIDSLRSYHRERRQHFQRINKRALWASNMAISLANIIPEDKMLVNGFSNPMKRLVTLTETLEKVCKSNYVEYHKKEAETLQSNDIQMSLIIPYEEWLDDFDVGPLEEINFGDGDVLPSAKVRKATSLEARKLEMLLDDEEDDPIAHGYIKMEKSSAASTPLCKKESASGFTSQSPRIGYSKSASESLQNGDEVRAVNSTAEDRGHSKSMFDSDDDESEREIPKRVAKKTPTVEAPLTSPKERKRIVTPPFKSPVREKSDAPLTLSKERKRIVTPPFKSPVREKNMEVIKRNGTTKGKCQPYPKEKPTPSPKEKPTPSPKEKPSPSLKVKPNSSFSFEAVNGKVAHEKGLKKSRDSNIANHSEDDIISSILKDMRPLDKLECLDSSFSLLDRSDPLQGLIDEEEEGNDVPKDVRENGHPQGALKSLNDSSEETNSARPKTLVSQSSEGFSMPDVANGSVSLLEDLGIPGPENIGEDDSGERGSVSIPKIFDQKHNLSQSFSLDEEQCEKNGLEDDDGSGKTACRSVNCDKEVDDEVFKSDHKSVRREQKNLKGSGVCNRQSEDKKSDLRNSLSDIDDLFGVISDSDDSDDEVCIQRKEVGDVSESNSQSCKEKPPNIGEKSSSFEKTINNVSAVNGICEKMDTSQSTNSIFNSSQSDTDGAMSGPESNVVVKEVQEVSLEKKVPKEDNIDQQRLDARNKMQSNHSEGESIVKEVNSQCPIQSSQKLSRHTNISNENHSKESSVISGVGQEGTGMDSARDGDSSTEKSVTTDRGEMRSGNEPTTSIVERRPSKRRRTLTGQAAIDEDASSERLVNSIITGKEDIRASESDKTSKKTTDQFTEASVCAEKNSSDGENKVDVSRHESVDTVTKGKKNVPVPVSPELNEETRRIRTRSWSGRKQNRPSRPQLNSLGKSNSGDKEEAKANSSDIASRLEEIRRQYLAKQNLKGKTLNGTISKCANRDEVSEETLKENSTKSSVDTISNIANRDGVLEKTLKENSTKSSVDTLSNIANHDGVSEETLKENYIKSSVDTLSNNGNHIKVSEETLQENASKSSVDILSKYSIHDGASEETPKLNTCKSSVDTISQYGNHNGVSEENLQENEDKSSVSSAQKTEASGRKCSPGDDKDAFFDDIHKMETQKDCHGGISRDDLVENIMLMTRSQKRLRRISEASSIASVQLPQQSPCDGASVVDFETGPTPRRVRTRSSSRIASKLGMEDPRETESEVKVPLSSAEGSDSEFRNKQTALEEEIMRRRRTSSRILTMEKKRKDFQADIERRFSNSKKAKCLSEGSLPPTPSETPVNRSLPLSSGTEGSSQLPSASESKEVELQSEPSLEFKVPEQKIKAVKKAETQTGLVSQPKLISFRWAIGTPKPRSPVPSRYKVKFLRKQPMVNDSFFPHKVPGSPVFVIETRKWRNQSFSQSEIPEILDEPEMSESCVPDSKSSNDSSKATHASNRHIKSELGGASSKLSDPAAEESEAEETLKKAAHVSKRHLRHLKSELGGASSKLSDPVDEESEADEITSHRMGRSLHSRMRTRSKTEKFAETTAKSSGVGCKWSLSSQSSARESADSDADEVTPASRHSRMRTRSKDGKFAETTAKSSVGCKRSESSQSGARETADSETDEDIPVSHCSRMRTRSKDGKFAETTTKSSVGCKESVMSQSSARESSDSETEEDIVASKKMLKNRKLKQLFCEESDSEHQSLEEDGKALPNSGSKICNLKSESNHSGTSKRSVSNRKTKSQLLRRAVRLHKKSYYSKGAQPQFQHVGSGIESANQGEQSSGETRIPEPPRSRTPPPKENKTCKFLSPVKKDASEIAKRLSANMKHQHEGKRTTILLDKTPQSLPKRIKRCSTDIVSSPLLRTRTESSVLPELTDSDSNSDHEDVEDESKSALADVRDDEQDLSLSKSNGESTSDEENSLQICEGDSLKMTDECKANAVDSAMDKPQQTVRTACVDHPGFVSSLAHLGNLARPKLTPKVEKPVQTPACSAPASSDFVNRLFSKMGKNDVKSKTPTGPETIESQSSSLGRQNSDKVTSIGVRSQNDRGMERLKAPSWPQPQQRLESSSASDNHTRMDTLNFYGSQNKPPSYVSSKNPEPEDAFIKSPTPAGQSLRKNSRDAAQGKSIDTPKSGHDEISDFSSQVKDLVSIVNPVNAPVSRVLEAEERQEMGTYLHEVCETIMTTRIGSQEWHQMMGRLCNNKQLRQEANAVARAILKNIMEADPSEKREYNGGLPPSLFKLYQAMTLFERRQCFPVAHVRNIVMQSIHKLIVSPRPLRVNSVVSMTVWFAASVVLPDSNKKIPLEWFRSFFLDVLYHRPEVTHHAMLLTIRTARRVMIQFSKDRQASCLEKLIHWRVLHGKWDGSSEIRTSVINWICTYGSNQAVVHKNPMVFSQKLLEELSACTDEAYAHNIIMTIKIFIRWQEKSWVEGKFLPRVKSYAQANEAEKSPKFQRLFDYL